MFLNRTFSRGATLLLATALLACQQPLPTAKLVVSPAALPVPLKASIPKRKLMSVSQGTWDSLAADWPELGAEGIDDLIDLKSTELSASTAALEATGTESKATLAISTPEGWVYLENQKAISTYALERHVERQFPTQVAPAQGYKLAALPDPSQFNPPYSIDYELSTAMYGMVSMPKAVVVGMTLFQATWACINNPNFVSLNGSTAAWHVMIGHGTPDPFSGCNNTFNGLFTAPSGFRNGGGYTAPNSAGSYYQMSLPGPYTYVKGVTYQYGSSYGQWANCSVASSITPLARDKIGRLQANGELQPDETAGQARKAKGTARVATPSTSRKTIYRDSATGEIVTTTGPAPGEGVRPTPAPSTEPTATPTAEPTAQPTPEPSIPPSPAPSASSTPDASPSPSPSLTPSPSPSLLPSDDPNPDIIIKRDQFEAALAQLNTRLAENCTLVSAKSYRLNGVYEDVLEKRDALSYTAANQALYGDTLENRTAGFLQFAALQNIPMTPAEATQLAIGYGAGALAIKGVPYLFKAAADLVPPSFKNQAVNKFCELLKSQSGTLGRQPGKVTIQSGATLTQWESAMVKLLSEEGREVTVLAKSNTAFEKTCDFVIDGVKTELKTLTGLSTKDVSGAISTRIVRASDQASHIIIDATLEKNVIVTLSDADRAARRAFGADTVGRIEYIRIIGPGFNHEVRRTIDQAP